MQLSREEAARAGRALRTLVHNEAFETAIEIVREQYRTQVFDSRPQDRELREMAYQEAVALDRLLSTINSLIAIHETEVMEDFDLDDEPLE